MQRRKCAMRICAFFLPIYSSLNTLCLTGIVLAFECKEIKLFLLNKVQEVQVSDTTEDE